MKLGDRLAKLEGATRQRGGAWLRSLPDAELERMAAGLPAELVGAIEQMTMTELEAIVDGDLSPLRRVGVEI